MDLVNARWQQHRDELLAVIASYKRELADAKEKIEFLKKQVLDQQRTLERLQECGYHYHWHTTEWRSDFH